MITLTVEKLREALDLRTRIEELEKKLTELLGSHLNLVSGVSAAAPVKTTSKPGRKPVKKKSAGKKPGGPKKAAPVAVAPESPAPRRRGRPPKKAAAAPKARRKGAGKVRIPSPSGSLADAVVKVLQRSPGPLGVSEIFDGLAQDGYVWTVSEPRKNLAARVYKLEGVAPLGKGRFDLASRAAAPRSPALEAPAPSATEAGPA